MFIFNSPEHQQAVQQLNNLWNNLQALADLAVKICKRKWHKGLPLCH